MTITEIIHKQLAELGLESSNTLGIEEIRNKDGVYVFRIKAQNQSYVLKYLENEKYRREINNYRILKELGIPTIRFFGFTDRSILLEDLDKSEDCRLGVEEDLSDLEVAWALARWYKELHNKSQEYIAVNKEKFYREIDCITKENLEMVKERSESKDNKVWDLIFENLDLVVNKIKGLGEVLTYNDFYWTNFAVGSNKKKAIMFDYNLLGVGLRYNDIRNVCSSLTPEAAKVFILEYGELKETEKIIDEVTGTLVGLIFAYQRTNFPSWGEEPLEALRNGDLERAFRGMLKKLF